MIFLCDSYGEIGIGQKNLCLVLDFENSNSQILISLFSIFFTQEQYDKLMQHLHICISVQKMTDRQRNKYTCFAWAGGTFFTVVLLCQLLVLAGNRFWFYILMHLEYNTVVVLCQFLVLVRNSFLCYVSTQCMIQLCGQLCQFFGYGGKQFSK